MRSSVCSLFVMAVLGWHWRGVVWCRFAGIGKKGRGAIAMAEEHIVMRWIFIAHLLCRPAKRVGIKARSLKVLDLIIKL